MSGTAIVDVPEKHRYELRLDGVFAGLTEYVEREGRRIFHHTEVADAFEGQGLASILVRAALSDVRDKGMRFAATCPYVTKWITRHHDFDDILDPVTDEDRDALRAAG